MMNNMTTFTEEQKKRKQENAQKTLGSNQAFAGLTDFQKLYEMIVEAFGYSAEDLMKEMAPEDQMKTQRMKMNKTLEEPKNWEKGNVIKSSVGELDHMLLIEAVIPNTCVIFTRKIWYENGKMVQAPLGFDDINDLYTYGWRKTNPVSSNFAFENQSNEK